MVMVCKLKLPCYLAECRDGCKLEREDRMAALTKDGKPLRYIVCPCVLPGEPNACMDPECLKANKCLDLEYGGDAVKAIAAQNMQAAHSALDAPEHALATDTHKCPEDGNFCALLSCEGGKDCYSKRKAEGRLFTTSSSKDITKPGYNYGTGAGHTTHHTTSTKACHTGMCWIGKIGAADIYLGKEWDAKGWDQAVDGPIGMIIGLLGDPYPQGPVVGVNNKAMEDLPGLEKLMYITPPVPNIWIKWPDYGIVPFKKEWWHKLMGILDEVEGAVLIYCMGGHGRTGTAAAIIATLGGLVPLGECPVEWLRSVYCEKVVESQAQIGYIEAITGRKVTADVSKSWGGYTYSAGSAHKGSGNLAITDKDEKKNSLSPSRGGAGFRGQGKRYRTGEPQKLSIKKWKQWWKHQAVATLFPHLVNVTRPKDLPNGQVFTIGKRQWKWNKDEHVFIEVKKGKAQ